MFAVIKVISNESKFRDIFGKGKIQSERITLPSGGVFFLVTVETCRGKIPWKKLERCLGVLKEAVVFCHKTAIPDGIAIKQFIPERFPLIMFYKWAANSLDKASTSINSLCIRDEYGLFLPYMESLIKYFGEIKIITPLTDEYDNLSSSLMQKYGVSLLVTEKSKLNSDVVISPDSDAVDITFSGELYTIEKRQLLSGRVMCPTDLILPLWCDELCPCGVDRLTFASALYEKCDASELAEAEFGMAR